MRTSTGSISVTKIIQKKNIRKGNRKYTTAKADSIEMAIFPTAMVNAMTVLIHIMRATGGVPGPSPNRTVVKLEMKWLPGNSDIGACATSCAVWVDATIVTYSGKA